MNTPVNQTHYPFSYKGNIIWPILLLIVWPWLGILLCLKNGRIRKETTVVRFSYRGEFFWLFFWTIFCFPIAILLFLINGADLCEEKLLEGPK